MRRITDESPQSLYYAHTDLVLRNHVALVSTDLGVQVWDLVRLERKQSLLAAGQRIAAAALRPDERVAVTAASDGTVETWDVETGTRLGPRVTWQDGAIPPEKRGFRNLTILSRDGNIVARRVGERSVRLRDLRAGTPIGVTLELSSPLECAAFSPDGKAFATAGTAYELWESATGRRLVSGSFPERSRVQAQPNANGGGYRVPDAEVQYTRAVQEFVRGKAVSSPERSVAQAVSFSPDGKILATSWRSEGFNFSSAHARLWNVATGQPLGELPLVRRLDMTSICFSADGQLLGTLDIGGTNRWWNARTFDPVSEPFWQYRGYSRWTGGSSSGDVWQDPTAVPRTSMTFADDGKYCYTIDHCDTGSYLVKWAVPEKLGGEVVPGFKLGVPPTSVKTADGLATVKAEADGTVTFVHSLGPEEEGPVHHGGAVLAIAISPDGRTLATGSADTTAQLWDLHSGRSIGPSLAHRRGPIRRFPG